MLAMGHPDYGIFPNSPVTEAEESRANLERYFRVALDVVRESADPSFDISLPHHTMTERSNSTLES